MFESINDLSSHLITFKNNSAGKCEFLISFSIINIKIVKLVFIIKFARKKICWNCFEPYFKSIVGKKASTKGKIANSTKTWNWEWFSLAYLSGRLQSIGRLLICLILPEKIYLQGITKTCIWKFQKCATIGFFSWNLLYLESSENLERKTQASWITTLQKK